MLKGSLKKYCLTFFVIKCPRPNAKNMLKVFSIVLAKQGKHNNKAYPNPIIVQNLFRTNIKWRTSVTKD